MAYNITLLKPENTTNVSIDTEVVVNIYESVMATIDTSLIIIMVDIGGGASAVFQSNTFQNGWTGEIIHNEDYDKTIVCIKPAANPSFDYDKKITVFARVIV